MIKKFENFNDLDPWGEEDWEELEEMKKGEKCRLLINMKSVSHGVTVNQYNRGDIIIFSHELQSPMGHVNYYFHEDKKSQEWDYEYFFLRSGQFERIK